ncbi:MAG TPA: hypothetical protein VF940_13065 [Streptosporangiaceae bacterium]
MHGVDRVTEHMIRSVLAYAENRLRLDPVPLDQGSRDPAVLDPALAGLIDEDGNDPDQLPLWFSRSLHGIRAYSDAIERAITLARETAGEITRRDDLELIMELLDQQVAFMPPTTWEGKTVARFAFLHPHTPMDLVVAVLDGMA